MKKEALVGFVFLTGIVLATFGTIAVSGFGLFAKQVSWYVSMPNLSGLQVGDDVRVLGHRMGTVRRIKFDNETQMFLVTLRMEADVPLYKGYHIAVRQSSTIGGRHLSVEPGSPRNEQVDTAALEASEGVGDIIAGVSDILAELKKVVNYVGSGEGTLGQLVFHDDLYVRLRDTADSLRTIASRVEQGQGTIGKFVNDDEFYVQVKDLVTKLNTGKGALARLLSDDSGTIVDDLRSASASIKSMAEKMNSGQGTVARMVNDPKAYEDASRFLASAAAAMDDIRSGKGVAGMLISDEAARRTASESVQNLRDASDSLRIILAGLRSGEGTMGRLLVDDALYENTTGLAKRLNSVVAKVDSGQGTVAKLINEPELHDRVKKLISRAIDAIENARDSAPVTAIAGFLLSPFQ